MYKIPSNKLGPSLENHENAHKLQNGQWDTVITTYKVDIGNGIHAYFDRNDR